VENWIESATGCLFGYRTCNIFMNLGKKNVFFGGGFLDFFVLITGSEPTIQLITGCGFLDFFVLITGCGFLDFFLINHVYFDFTVAFSGGGKLKNVPDHAKRVVVIWLLRELFMLRFLRIMQ
jgi:hypothetical protein